jgi:hypothetical protein
MVNHELGSNFPLRRSILLMTYVPTLPQQQSNRPPPLSSCQHSGALNHACPVISHLVR